MTAHKIHGDYTRETDGKTFAYWGKLEGFRYEIRVWPIEEKPHDVLALPVAFEGDLAKVSGGNEPSLVHKIVGNLLEDWVAQPEQQQDGEPEPGKTTLRERLGDGEVELVSTDPATVTRAGNARLNRTLATFVFWNGEEEEEISGKVVSCRDEKPFRFMVRAEEAS